ncbi:MAG: NAD(P)H-binding protein [Elusimicrobia bacterium]|nr:NAD(P)H-binding protein [Elusimicrobiota bacterium]
MAADTPAGLSPRGPVVVAGATGFVGWALARFLSSDYRVIGLSRMPPRTDAGNRIEWRSCDLFSLQQCEAALDGASRAFYLVHSMWPSARFTQGNFEDMDLICADNFARAAAKAGVKQIVYLGGLIPDEPDLSPHLRSRLEVEETLGSWGVSVTALRAGIVIGPFGSSYRIFRTLVERVPVIPCPAWTRSLTQPVALDDVLALLRYCLDHPAPRNRDFDIGSPDVMSYRELIERTARIMDLKRTFIDVPFSGTLWCRWWLSRVTGAPREMVSPLLESVRHSMVARDRGFQKAAGVPGIPFEAAVRAALSSERAAGREDRPPADQRSGRRMIHQNDVRSVQRMPLPAGLTARQVAERYSDWLPGIFRTFVRADVDGGKNVRFRPVFSRTSLLDLAFFAERSGLADRQVFIIAGGLLARRVAARSSGRPRLEFREVLRREVLLVAIHDYHPTLPWYVYNCTQALLHLWVMRSFARHLSELAQGPICR